MNLHERSPGIRVLILAMSLDPKSRSLKLAEHAQRQLQGRGVATTLLNMRDLTLPLCDGTEAAGKHPNVLRLREAVRGASRVLFAVPIYNYDVNAAAKNVVEHLFNWSCYNDGEWEGVMGKVAGFLCAAGGHHSYMSVLSFANTLMLECRWWIVPRFVYAVGKDFEGDTIQSPKILERIDRLLDELIKGAPTSSNP